MKILFKPMFLSKISKYLKKNVKDKSNDLLKLWAEQSASVFAQRLRRSQQMYYLYARIWDEKSLKELLHSLRRQLQRHAKGVLLSSIALCNFDWDNDRIQLESIKDNFNEFDFIDKLQKLTLYCSKCEKRKFINYTVEGVEYCKCAGGGTKTDKEVINIVANCSQYNEWEPYIEQDNMITWRREEKPGFYSYKVFVQYDDISAEDFLFVQTDIEYRKKWDNTAIALDIIDTDPKNSDSQIIYWEMLWPKFFSNRDYVYNRRYFVDKSRRIMVIVNKSVQHPKCPEKSSTHRVNEYWSFMVIKPKTTFAQNGVEFVLTYFDNPGLSIPSSITSWVAQRQMPEFLSRLHQATIDFASKRKQNEARIDKFWDKVSEPGYEYPPEQNITFFDDSNDTIYEWTGESEIDDNLNEVDVPPIKKVESESNSHDVARGEDDHEDNNSDDEICDEEEEYYDVDTVLEADGNSDNKKHSWWSYLHPYSYFV